MPRSRALARPRPHRTKHPERWGIQLNEQNRPILLQMLAMLERLQDVYDGDFDRRRHLEAVHQSIALLRSILDTNPRELVLDPDDFVKRSILLYLDETCWGLILRWTPDYQYAAGYAAYT